MLKVTLLGTGGTQPLPDRALAAAAVTVGGRSVLLDCGEGTQVGLRRYGVSAYRLSAPSRHWPGRRRTRCAGRSQTDHST